MGKIGKIISTFIIIGILGVVGYSGYAEKTAIENLEIELVDVTITRIGLTDCDIVLVLRFYNPSDYDTPTFSVKFDIYIADHLVGYGSLPEMYVPAHSEAYGDLKIMLKYAKIIEAAIDAIIRGEFTLSLVGTVEAGMIFGLIPISQSFEAYYVYG